jgi:hypothetical protein
MSMALPVGWADPRRWCKKFMRRQEQSGATLAPKIPYVSYILSPRRAGSPDFIVPGQDPANSLHKLNNLDVQPIM